MQYSEVTLLQAVSNIASAVKAAGQLSGNSLIERSQAARVEPMVMIDSTVRHVPWIEDVLQTLTSSIAGYYLLAVELSGSVGNVQIIKKLDQVNPSRSLMSNLESRNDDADNVAVLANSYKYRLPLPNQSVGLEAYGIEAADDNLSGSLREVKDVTNLAVGKMIEVPFESNGHKKRIPVNIRLITTEVNPSTLIGVLDASSKGKDFKGRIRGVKSGRLSFIRDMVFCQDLIDEYKKARMKDTNDVYGAIISRRNRNRLAAVMSGEVSLATASNIMILSENTVKELEARTGLRMRDFRSREKYFQNTYTMIFAVIDPRDDVVTFYHRSIEQPTMLSDKQLKVSQQKSGPNVGDILQAYKIGSAPSLL